MHLLTLGGTQFLGRHVVEIARERGHEVTMFHRGRTGADLFPDVERVLGDRVADLSRLAGRTFDAVVDLCGYKPADVAAAATALSGHADAYLFVSSLSVLADKGPRGQDESAALAELPADADPEQITGETYGPLKALCEHAARAHFDGRVLVIRPGLIVGPHDPTDRFSYWPRRMAQAGEVLVPPLDQPVQVIDARDLANWMVRLLEAHIEGTLSAAGPREPLVMRDVVRRCCEVLGTEPSLVEVDEAFLLEHGVDPFSELPLWVPREAVGLLDVDLTEAKAHGIAWRDLGETIADTYRWDSARPPDTEITAGLTLERERGLLEAWRARSG